MHYHKLLIWQYRHKPKALATIKLFEQEIAQGFVDLSRLPEVMDIETATGANLDLVGKHVGQPRVINGYQLRKFFGFRGSPLAMPFKRRWQGGGQWYRKRDPLRDAVRLSDDDYRFLIKCRILRNYQTGTVANLIDACQFVFGVKCQVMDNYDMSVSIDIPRHKMTDFKKFAIEHLDILPRQVGVKFHYQLTE
ncbi:DUF2612 domain-containing protein [Avibacterium paragallinarum]|uniref:DUF2612 domain-containing protein n=1 Tax=Avibacterium paragallinarum TaxID=728 RepID=UPI002EA9131E|nr:DUF2612 domain-containing protein [Avibacterium paragallinarum]MEE3621729.1 DUF2612 domain-containing protein [Avibacterium paragallinarum]MEE3669477.1 DUF2612 domain-containing protein [Avibacterium paragallinarum]MEE3681801.1 DUF2612 domain-containing protein [Avibacterium paragallinarum]MEE4387049.1 DUF2612 domain-containing protein [Avibacterium paragallinarum]